MEVLNKVNAKVYLEIVCKCPHCNSILDVTFLTDFLDETLNCIGYDDEIECDECGKAFVINNILH